MQEGFLQLGNEFSTTVGNKPLPIAPKPSPVNTQVDFTIKKPTPAPTSTPTPTPTYSNQYFPQPCIIGQPLIPFPNDYLSMGGNTSTRSYHDVMKAQQNQIANLFSQPNFTPNFSLSQSFGNMMTVRQEHHQQQPIYNMGTINIHNHYSSSNYVDSPFKGKQLRVISDSNSDEE